MADEDRDVRADNDDELGQYEGSYEDPGPQNDAAEEYGTGGGDVGIGGDVSPHGETHSAEMTASDIEADDFPDDDERLDRGVGERAEDLELVSDDVEDQGVDEAWPREPGEVDEADPRLAYDDRGDPGAIVDDDDIEDAA